MSVHPRACGEHEKKSCAVLYECGSSPRLRGTSDSASRKPFFCRFIPAPAGNIPVVLLLRPGTTVHPRACGEHVPLLWSSHQEGGSSPRLRGTSPRQRDYPRHRRFIPAPAGNMTIRCTNGSPAAVHPRACGEHSVVGCEGLGRCGSSPRLRGTSLRAPRCLALSRFIPAPAGNMPAPLSSPAIVAVHPRACGEHDMACYEDASVVGSSPRLRGT